MTRIRRACRLLKLAATDPRIPRPVRWLLIVGLLPIPGPVDEVFLVLAAVLLMTVFRTRMRVIAAEQEEQL